MLMVADHVFEKWAKERYWMLCVSHTYTRIATCISIYMHMYVYTHTHMYINTHIYMYISMYTSTYTYMCICTYTLNRYMYITCMHICCV